jgi:hypothetical protein
MEGCWLLPRPGSVEAAQHRLAQQQLQQRLQQQGGPAAVSTSTTASPTSTGAAAVGAAATAAAIGASAAAQLSLAGAAAAAAPPAPQPQQQQQQQQQRSEHEPLLQRRVVVIMRGLPGAGKSTRAAQLAARAAARQLSADVHSTDAFFVDAATGVYAFNPELLGAHHAANQAAFRGSIAAGVDVVIVDNTNIQVRAHQPGPRQARKHAPPASRRLTHTCTKPRARGA